MSARTACLENPPFYEVALMKLKRHAFSATLCGTGRAVFGQNYPASGVDGGFSQVSSRIPRKGRMRHAVQG
jgi:hypothetical protein